MKFGRILIEEVDVNSLDLPKDHPQNKSTLSGGKKELSVFTGCAKFSVKEWKGSIYPEKTKAADFLEAYMDVFNSIEMNGTFYRLSRSSIEKWRAAAKGRDFVFCPKWSRRISHLKRLKEVEENVQYFLDSVYMLEDNLGPSFLQMPENFGPKPENVERLHHFLSLVPKEHNWFLELRKGEWFEEPVLEETMALMESHGVGVVYIDSPGRRDVLQQRLTNKKVMIRFNGYEGHAIDAQRIKNWVNRIKDWNELGLEEVYFFAHQPDEVKTPASCNLFVKEMNQQLSLKLKEVL